MSTTTARIYNFSSGPAVLPVPVLEQIQRDLVMLPGVGMSVPPAVRGRAAAKS